MRKHDKKTVSVQVISQQMKQSAKYYQNIVAINNRKIKKENIFKHFIHSK
jgi:hypothetical protein